MTDEKVIPMTVEDAAREEPRRGLFGMPKKAASGFVDFIRERGVAGLLLGFVLGGAITKVTTSFSNDILTPSLAVILGSTDRLADLALGNIAIGKFVVAVIDFLIIALVLYLLFRVFGLDKIDKPKG